MFTFLDHRNRQEECIDSPDVDPAVLGEALNGLSRINFWSRTASSMWPVIEKCARSDPHRPVRILDVATGGGDVPLRLWRRAKVLGVSVELSGCDQSETALAHARACAARAGAPLKFFQLDVLRNDFPGVFDVITCSLFLHHLEEGQAVSLLRRVSGAARRAIVVSDLERRRAGYLLAAVATRILSRSAMVHSDGLRSVEGAFTIAEARRLAESAGLTCVEIRRTWPCRWLLTWFRSTYEPV